MKLEKGFKKGALDWEKSEGFAPYQPVQEFRFIVYRINPHSSQE